MSNTFLSNPVESNHLRRIAKWVESTSAETEYAELPSKSNYQLVESTSAKAKLASAVHPGSRCIAHADVYG